MSSEPPSFRSDAEERRHDYRTTLTTMRLQTQLLLRATRHLDGPVGEQFAGGLTRIDEAITKLLGQFDQHDPE